MSSSVHCIVTLPRHVTATDGAVCTSSIESASEACFQRAEGSGMLWVLNPHRGSLARGLFKVELEEATICCYRPVRQLRAPAVGP